LTLLHSSDLWSCSLLTCSSVVGGVQASLLRANDGSSIAATQEVAVVFAKHVQVCLLWQLNPQFKWVSRVEESRTLYLGVGCGKTYNIMFLMKGTRTALLLTGDTSPGPDDIPFSMLRTFKLRHRPFYRNYITGSGETVPSQPHGRRLLCYLSRRLEKRVFTRWNTAP
ncbi:hypothetical protein Hamer_G002929, partial [Homarus americanus]